MTVDRLAAVERMARAVHYHGWSSLSLSEENVLGRDRQLLAEVRAFMQKLKRADLLKAKGVFDRDVDLRRSADWAVEDGFVRRADLWANDEPGRAVLEIKQWSTREYGGAADMGAHEMLVQQCFDHMELSKALAKAAEYLAKYGCPGDIVREFCEE